MLEVSEISRVRLIFSQRTSTQEIVGENIKLQIREQLGKGGFGRVNRVTDIDRNKIFACKTVAAKLKCYDSITHIKSSDIVEILYSEEPLLVVNRSIIRKIYWLKLKDIELPKCCYHESIFFSELCLEQCIDIWGTNCQVDLLGTNERDIVFQNDRDIRLPIIPVNYFDFLKIKSNLVDEIYHIRDVGDHPSIIKIHDYYHSYKLKDYTLYILMDDAEGGNLKNHIIRRNGLQEDDSTKGWFLQILSAIKQCHENGIVHLDIKPANILLDIPPNQGQATAILADFGSSRKLTFSNGQYQPTKSLSGTKNYQAPEIFQEGSICNEKADVFSLGATLYFSLTQRVPFRLLRATPERENFRDFEAWVASHFDCHVPDTEDKIVYASIFMGQSLTRNAMNLIVKLMHPRVEKRLNVNAALSHPWFTTPTTATEGADRISSSSSSSNVGDI